MHWIARWLAGNLAWLSPMALFFAGLLAGAAALSVQRASRQRRWRRSLPHLEQMLAQIRAGQASMDELSQVQGSLSPLAATIQDLLRELRQQKASYAQLQQEMGQRVAQRTDALERVIGGLRQQATRDPLTGLHNRRFLEQELPSLVESAWQNHGKLCLLMLDVDNFKSLNDTLGHAAGDELLRCIGQIIRSTIRQDDLAFRYGGDEFVVLMPDSGTAGEALARRLVSLVNELGRTLRTELPLGLSAGWATLGQLPEPRPAGLLAEADKSLYRAKSQRKHAA